MDKDKSLGLLKQKIKHIDELLKSMDRAELRQWREETLMILDNLIDEGSKYYRNFEEISFHSGVINMRRPDLNKQRDDEAMQNGLNKARSSLQAVVFGIEQGLF